MPLTTGTRFGPYEILAPIGAGGMGEVYRATDTTLGREVGWQDLDGDLAPERGVGRSPHLAHAASAYSIDEAVLSETLSRLQVHRGLRVGPRL
jgi:serine/threonine protein kinase